MKYTEFGSTGVLVSRLGFGCMRYPMTMVDGKPQVDVDLAIDMLRKAFELGVNYFDSAHFYHGGQSEVVLGLAVAGVRDKVNIATKINVRQANQPGDYRRLLEEQLVRLGTDHIDFHHLQAICFETFTDSEKRTGWYAEAVQAKSEGLINHISFSFHSPNFRDPAPDSLIQLIDTGLFESVLCQYNVLDRSNEPAMAYAKQKGLGVAVMGPLGGGRVSGLPKETAEKLGITAVASAELGLRFVASNPNVDIFLSGMSTMEQLLENAEIASRIEPLTSDEARALEKMMDENGRLAELYCTGCNYCMPCPQEVNIAQVFRAMNYHKVYGMKQFARQTYSEIGHGWTRGNRADACTECGECEKKCPQAIHIREQLKECRQALE